ncbi:class I lanthipeptide [Chitinophaga sp. 22536]|uniref:class I lanthipeptide n=1 Tax=unclassified Chitinophaga TaxID=2619133 RepID=UPI003F8339A3
MKKKNILLQKKVSLKKVVLANLNYDQQKAVRGGAVSVRCADTRCDGCDSYDPSCPTRPHRTLICW